MLFYSCVSASGLILMKQGLKGNEILKIDYINVILQWKLITGFTLYLLGFLIWLYILKQHSLTVAFPIASGLLYAVIIIGSSFFLKENIAIVRVFGIGLIFTGIYIVSRTQ
jgi:drug/metabolite transporter (DMT)-like permease